MDAQSIRGVLFEEVVAHLLRTNGLQLIHEAAEDPYLKGDDGQLFIRGRGFTHQADALADFVFTPPFSLPVRILVEAKSRTRRVGLSTSRELKGLIEDINQFDAPDPNPATLRYQYVPVLVSESGFSKGAADYAVAHRLNPLDLSGPTFDGVRTGTRTAAKSLARISESVKGPFPVQELRVRLRRLLDNPGTPEPARLNESQSRDVDDALGPLVDVLMDFGKSIVLAFGGGGHVFPLLMGAHDALHLFADTNLISVRFVYEPGENDGDMGRYNMVLPDGSETPVVMPASIMGWIQAADKRELVQKIRATKQKLLGRLMVYVENPAGGIRSGMFQYDPADVTPPQTSSGGADDVDLEA